MSKDNFAIQFACYAVLQGEGINESLLKKFKEHLIESTTEMEMCGTLLFIGDYVEAEIVSTGHLNGGVLTGKIKKLYPHIPQAQLENGWCFHPSDIIRKHIPNSEPATEVK